MKKLIISALAAVVFNIFSPVAPLVHAATLQDQLTQVIGQDGNAARIQQMLALKKQLEQGNKQELLSTLTKTAFAQYGQGEMATALDAVTQGNINQVAQNALFQELKKNIGDKMVPYEKEIGVISTLFSNQLLTPKATLNDKVLLGAPQNYKRIIDMTATAYAPGELDNGKWKNQTYVGGIVKHGVVAVDPKVIPMGTKLWVEGYGEAIADDQGSAIKGNRIDLAFDNRSEALDYGIKQVKIYVL